MPALRNALWGLVGDEIILSVVDLTDVPGADQATAVYRLLTDQRSGPLAAVVARVENNQHLLALSALDEQSLHSLIERWAVRYSELLAGEPGAEVADEHRFIIRPDFAARLAELAGSQDRTVADAVLAACRIVLAHHMGDRKVMRVAIRFPDFLRRMAEADTDLRILVDYARATGHPAFGELIARPCRLGPVPAGADVVLRLRHGDEGLAGTVECHAGLGIATTGLAGQLSRVLDIVAARPDVPLVEIDIVPAAERHRLLVEYNDTRHEIPATTLPDAFAEQLRRTPEAVAVMADGLTLTYAELDVRANHLAHRLIGLGLRVEQPVGLLMERSVDVVVAELAIIKAGGAYLPLGVRAPAECMRLVLAEAGVPVVISDAAHRRQAETIHGGRILLVDGGGAAEAPRVALHPDNLAYAMYTSGATGTPKGVAVRHRDVLALAFDRRFRDHERVLLHSPLTFDAATYELWVPLLNGGRVVVASPGDLDADTLRGLITGHGVTAMWLTAGLFRLVAQDAPDSFAGLREVWTGGVVPAAAVRRVLEACPGLTVVGGYGPTETTTFATAHPMPDAATVPDTVPIGRPLDNMHAYVLDARLRPVPAGVAGELFLAGAGVSRGYLNQPGVTASRFIANPHARPGERMYRTGDVVRWTTGVIEFAGRTDDQAEIRGFRVEPGEIESVPTTHPGMAGWNATPAAPSASCPPSATPGCAQHGSRRVTHLPSQPHLGR